MRMIFARFFLFSGAILVTSPFNAQPSGYYTSAEGLTGTALQQALHNIIDDHLSVDYATLWTSFQSTDKKADGNVWDMYSDVPGGTPSYTYIFITDQCGSYSKEGDCYNREHSFPKSWFGGEVAPMYTDLFHLYPTDGYVNNQRANFPLGVTNSPTWTSTNGSKLGPGTSIGYSGTVFEPVNGFKGDFARTYLYMAVRYFSEDSGWPGSEMVTGSQLKPWALKLMLEWDQTDPVSQKERDRNEAVYLIQGNRNPFIDNPLYAGLIWGTANGTESVDPGLKINIWPNPGHSLLNIGFPDGFARGVTISLYDLSGRLIERNEFTGQAVQIDVGGIVEGYYILSADNGKKTLFVPVIISH